MTPANDVPVDQLVGKRVAFQEGDDHAGCWHQKAGLKTGVVLRRAPTLAQKAELLAAEGIELPERARVEAEGVRLWIRVDPCPSFPRGCETAAEPECLLLADC